jgi:hypothetical protein
MKEKAFRLRADEIREIAPRRGACIASDEITVGGKRVGYMYREEPANEVDSDGDSFPAANPRTSSTNPRTCHFTTSIRSPTTIPRSWRCSIAQSALPSSVTLRVDSLRSNFPANPKTPHELITTSPNADVTLIRAKLE